MATGAACFESSQLAFLVFGAIFGTLLLCAGFLVILLYWAKHKRWVTLDIPGCDRFTRCATSKGKPAKCMSDFRLPAFINSRRVHPTAGNNKQNKTIVYGIDEIENRETSAEKATDFRIVNFDPRQADDVLPIMQDPSTDISESVGYSVTTLTNANHDVIIDKVDSTLNNKLTPGDQILGVELSLCGLTSAQIQAIMLQLASCKYKLKIRRSDVQLAPKAEFNEDQNKNTTNTDFVEQKLAVVTHSEISSTPSATIGSPPPSLPSNSPPTSSADEDIHCNHANYVNSAPQTAQLEMTTANPSRGNEESSWNNTQNAISDQNSDTLKHEKSAVGSDVPVHVTANICNNTGPTICNENEVKELNNGIVKESNNNKQTDQPLNNGTSNGNDPKVILSAEQCGTLEVNRRRLENERQHLRQLGII
ncbi:hypothetical protein DdX_05015 [Ditylenchus destructor]|uniref:PDZ domain-containing protein n=1 Tax=Ditylenchus destructor TaxID=166010 RepID=A0AAD4NDK9_9BILA|nr:hypothetical protein DdX_05015 [Ditylenchus destructor]